MEEAILLLGHPKCYERYNESTGIIPHKLNRILIHLIEKSICGNARRIQLIEELDVTNPNSHCLTVQYLNINSL